MQAGKREGDTPLSYSFEGSQKKRWFFRFVMTVLGMLFLSGALSLTVPAAVLAASDSLEITGDGVTFPLSLTLEELKEMDQEQYVYSAVNTWPTKKWYVGQGVKLWDLLLKAGLKKEEAQLIKFTSIDSYTVTLTMKELFQDTRYCFLHFKTGGDGDGHIPGDASVKVEVEPLIGLVSVEGSDNPKYMNDMNSLLLMLGQRAVTEQTGNLFVKYLSKIEVLTAEPEKWDVPQANPDSGTVPAGTMVALSNMHNDDDKIYYTTDGSTPTLNSPIYNWIASRWWSARADVLGVINRPIGPIDKNTTIKALTIGPGKRDSDVVTFSYQVAGTTPVKIIKLTIGQMEASVDGGLHLLDAVPYVDTVAGRTLVPVRFVSEILGAGVDWDPKAKKVTITDGGKLIVLVLNSSQVQIDGVEQVIDCVPVMVPPGRIFVPLRFVGETLKAKVDYVAETREVTITR